MFNKNYIFIFLLLSFFKIYSSDLNNNMDCFKKILQKFKNILCINERLKKELKKNNEFYNQKYEKYKNFIKEQLNSIIFKITLSEDNKFKESEFLKNLKDNHDKKKSKILDFIKIFPNSEKSKYLEKLIEDFEYFYRKKRDFFNF